MLLGSWFTIIIANDGNKKIKGVKRHVVVDKNGFLLTVMVTIACIHDSKAAYLLARYLRELCCNIKIILADAGYREEIADKIKTIFGYILEVVVYKEKHNSIKRYFNTSKGTYDKVMEVIHVNLEK